MKIKSFIGQFKGTYFANKINASVLRYLMQWFILKVLIIKINFGS
jgi:hypothetical protein